MMERYVKGRRYVADAAGRAELPALHAFCTRVVPGGFAGLDKWLERHDRNPGIFFAVKSWDEGAPPPAARLVGGFAVTPLGGEARGLLDQARLKGVDLKVEHITPPGETPAAMYISGIAAEGLPARAATLEFLREVMRGAIARGTRLFYTRPMRGDGLRLVRAYGFEPVDPSATGQFDRVYRKEFDDDAALKSS